MPLDYVIHEKRIKDVKFSIVALQLFRDSAQLAATELTLAITDPACQITLAAAPLDDESAGKSFRFTGTHETSASSKSLKAR